MKAILKLFVLTVMTANMSYSQELPAMPQIPDMMAEEQVDDAAESIKGFVPQFKEAILVGADEAFDQVVLRLQEKQRKLMKSLLECENSGCKKKIMAEMKVTHKETGEQMEGKKQYVIDKNLELAKFENEFLHRLSLGLLMSTLESMTIDEANPDMSGVMSTNAQFPECERETTNKDDMTSSTRCIVVIYKGTVNLLKVMMGTTHKNDYKTYAPGTEVMTRLVEAIEAGNDLQAFPLQVILKEKQVLPPAPPVEEPVEPAPQPLN